MSLRQEIEDYLNNNFDIKKIFLKKIDLDELYLVEYNNKLYRVLLYTIPYEYGEDISKIYMVCEVKSANLLDKVKYSGFDTKYYEKKYGIVVKIQEPYALFKYRQGQCLFDEEWQKECRGSIINMNTLQFACRPFDKFFNYGEPLADTLDFNSPILVRDKEDGSLIKLWYSKEWKKWIFSTNGMIFAKESEVPNTILNYQQLIDKAWEDTYDYPKEILNYLDKNYTYMFELCTPMNIVVVPHDKYELIFLAKRHNITGGEHYSEDMFYIKPKEWHISTLQEAIDIISNLDANEIRDAEGLVITDINGKKIKMKTQTYLKIAYALDNPKFRTNLKFLWENIAEKDELCSYDKNLVFSFEKVEEMYQELKNKMLKEIEDCFKLPFQNKKELAKHISDKKYKYPGMLFDCYNGLNFTEILEKHCETSKQFKKLLDIYEINSCIVD